jgi:O-methyltransferase domain
LHDWPDEDCKKILANQKVAMKKGHSKLLLHEVVLDSQNPKGLGTASDIAMMAMASGMESTYNNILYLLSNQTGNFFTYTAYIHRDKRAMDYIVRELWVQNQPDLQQSPCYRVCD